MKRNLTEELKRIHSITYGKRVIEEQGFLDKILKGVGLKKSDDPKKADLVSDDVQEFFKTLQDSANSGGLSQQQRGSMSFQKGVESMQIGLILLGYELPKHGVDGLFGPETATAVSKFTTEKLGGDKKSVNEAVKLVSQGGELIGRPDQGTHNASDWQSGNAWDVTGPVGTEVYSITNGIVNKVKKASGGLIKSGVKKIYGDQVSVKSNDGKPDVFYTHIDSLVSQGDSVKEGDVIGKIMQIDGIPSHVHVGISSGNLSDLVAGLTNAVGGSASAQMTKATPEMLNKLIELLKERGVSSEDLQKHIDKNISTGAPISLDGDWLKIATELIKKWETFSDRASWDENAYRGGYGSGKKLVNGRLEPVTQNTTWTKQEAEDTLEYEIKNTYAPIIAKQLGMDNWNKLNDKQKASLISLGYNAGPYFVSARSYGKEIKNAIENNNMELAAQFIERGPTTGASSGQFYSGLQRRRSEESKIFLA